MTNLHVHVLNIRFFSQIKVNVFVVKTRIITLLVINVNVYKIHLKKINYVFQINYVISHVFNVEAKFLINAKFVPKTLIFQLILLNVNALN